MGMNGYYPDMAATADTQTQMDCGHRSVLVPYPRPADLVYCIRCADYRYVSFVRGWWAKCKTPTCSYHTAYSKNRDRTAERVKRHATNREHVIHLFFGTELSEVINGTKKEEECLTGI